MEYGAEIHSEQPLNCLNEEINALPTEDILSNVPPHLTPSTISPYILTNSYDVGTVIFENISKDSYIDDIS